jgi:hypothetical protein
MSHQEFRQRLARRLAWQRAAHDPVRDPRNLLPQLSLLRQWQSRRLAGSFDDFLADARMRPAAEFFLSDLYGDKDFSARDRDAARILPLMARLLPDTLLQRATEAIELAVLSHLLDLRWPTRWRDVRSRWRRSPWRTIAAPTPGGYRACAGTRSSWSCASARRSTRR